MKRVLAGLILILVSASVYATETGGTFSIGNNNLTAEPMTSTEFPGTEFPWGGSLYWKREASDNSGLEVGFYRDPVIRNIGYTNFYYNEDLFSISVGPFFGIFNTTETLIKSGISTSVKINIPGIAFAEFETQSTIGGRLVSTGDYIQEANRLGVGFYVYNAICTLQIDTKSYNVIDETYGSLSEDFTEYAFIADLFQKNVPYTMKLKLGYQNKVRVIESTESQSLNSVVLGTDVSIRPAEFLGIFIGLESSLYSFGSIDDSTADTSELLSFASEFPGNYLFNATIGFSLDLENINN